MSFKKKSLHNKQNTTEKNKNDPLKLIVAYTDLIILMHTSKLCLVEFIKMIMNNFSTSLACCRCFFLNFAIETDGWMIVGWKKNTSLLLGLLDKQINLL